MGVAQQLPYPDPRALRLALETLGRPAFEYDPSEPLVHFLHRHVSPSQGRVMNHHTSRADTGEHDEMVVVPVQDTG